MSSEGAPPRIPFTRRSAGDRLRSALLDLAGHKRQVVTHTEKAWASITFAGTRHSLALLFAGSEAVEAGEQFIAMLPEHEFSIPGQLVADASITEVEHRLSPSPRIVVTCDLLMLEDA